jgi:murein DD-endopeptidase MepM/ murein hydrolase activator NlpD
LNAAFRGLAIAATLGMVWTGSAARVSETSRLPVASVVRGAVLTQPFGCSTLVLEPFDPYCPTRHFHSGVDLAAPGGTPVYAATAGHAMTGYDEKGAGLFVSVAVDEHVRILYCHLQRAEFAAGDVTPGELIGNVGSSGLATGPHLHLEVQVDGRAVDPVRWLTDVGS